MITTMFIFLISAAVITIVLLIVQYSLDTKKRYKNLKDKHVVITGGSSGIGKSIAMEVGKLGAHVTIIGRDVGKLEATVKFLIEKRTDPHQKIQYAALDVTSEYKNIEECLSSLEAEVGPIFMLVNCAGMCVCGQFENMQVDDIKHMMDLNYYGTAYPTKYVLPGMKKRNEGIIVMVSSEAALLGIYGYSAYSASKWAVRGLAESVLMELVGTGVRLTISFPPDTDTPGLKNEDLSKPEETKLISGSSGLKSPDTVANHIIRDALMGRIYSVSSFSGYLLTLMYGGSIESPIQVLIQLLGAGIGRFIMVPILLSFNKIVQNKLKIKQAEALKNK